ncbi:hypothetical protein [Paramicrobacterium chengjingii]|uniref:hypothetical protein n=1 Tax=Paramicrobacterium chengjingii TaxID=2769067 RepID=UPI00142029C0|nr:hypothetical protein [Microbacterium chengjingii]
MVDARYALVWPRELFDWEARRVVQLPDEIIFDSIGHLLRESFQDSAVVDTYAHESGAYAGPWAAEAEYDRAQAWLRSLLANQSKLMPYVPPRYFAQREGHVSVPDTEPTKLLALAFAELLLEFQDQGYFPETLPRDCVDNQTSWEYVSSRAVRATHLPFDWGGEARDALTWDEPTLYSLIEYFHDGAQRPRTPGSFHDYGDCGSHYAEHSAESGGVVYRWRVNTLLETYGVELRLGTRGDERGRLIHTSERRSISPPTPGRRPARTTPKTRSPMRSARTAREEQPWSSAVRHSPSLQMPWSLGAGTRS